jgi:RNA polymerase sigma-70 factor (ECF subfamily)
VEVLLIDSDTKLSTFRPAYARSVPARYRGVSCGVIANRSCIARVFLLDYAPANNLGKPDDTVDYSALDDVTLIRLIGRAQSDALGVLYDRYNRLIFGLALSIVGDQATAEEITLDVFTRVWEKATTYRKEEAKVNTWLTSITRYRAIDELRRRQARPEKHSVEWAELSPDQVPRTNGVEIAAELAMQRQHVRSALAALPEEQRRVLTLAYFQGYTQREIAAALDLPLGTVKTRIRLAMKKLRELLREEIVVD